MPYYETPYKKRFVNFVEVNFEPKNPIIRFGDTEDSWKCSCGNIYKRWHIRKNHFNTIAHKIAVGELPNGYDTKR
jgi:hypothetical protein